MRSLCNKLPSFKQFLYDNSFIAAAITETWLQPDFPDNLYSVSGYTLVRYDRPERAGGVAIYVSNRYKFCEIHKGSIDSVEFVLIKIKIKTISLGLAAVYRPDDQTLTNLHVISDIIMTFYSNKIEHFVILGDFNVNLLGNRPSCKFLLEICKQHDCFQLVRHPTRVTDNTESLLDLVISNFRPDFIHADVLDTCFSDHNVVTCSLNLLSEKPAQSFRTVRSFKNLQLEDFDRDASHLNWDFVYYLGTLEEKVNYFNESLLSLFDKHAPEHVIRVTHNKRSNPWFTDTLKLLKKLVRKAWLKYTRTRHKTDRLYYTSLRNYYNTALTKEKKAYFASQIKSCGNKSAQLWRKFNAWHIRGDTSTSYSLPDHLKDPNILNDFFTSSMSDSNFASDSFPCSHISSDVDSRFELHLPDISDIIDRILKLKPNITGPDGISGRMLHLALPFIVAPLTHIINVSFETGRLPQQWKYCSTFPILKKTNATINNLSPRDFRPISILPVCLKVAESVLHTQLTEYAESCSLLPSIQSGFRRGFSTASALCNSLDDVISAVDRGLLTHLTLLDLSKAFDSVPFPLLIKKLSNYGIRNLNLDWLSSYLYDRTQFTIVNTELGLLHSEGRLLNSGVPQGSILGPLLFSLFIADLPHVVRNCSIQLFADDIQLFLSFPPCDVLQASILINEDLASIHDWTLRNSLSLNPSKCQGILMGSKHFCQLISEIDVSIAGVRIPCSDSLRNLGVIFDREVTFTNHVSQLCRRAYYSLKQLLPFKYLLDSQTKLLLCESLVLSLLDYGDVVYGPCINQSDGQRLQKLQNLCFRYITYIPRFSHVTPYIRSFNRLRMQERRFLHYCTFLHKIIDSGRPEYLFNKLSTRSDAHDLNLRYVSSKLSIPRHTSSFFKCSFSYLSVYLFNNFLCKNEFNTVLLLKNFIKTCILSDNLGCVNIHLF